MKAYPDFFKLGQKFPMSQELSFNNKEGDLTLAIDYDQTTPQLQGLPLTISQHKISKGKRAKADVPGSKVRLVIVLSNNHNQIPTLFDVKLVENWQEEEKIPIKTGPPKAAAPPKEEKKAEDGEKKEGEGDAAGADDKKEAEKVDETQQDQKYETKIKNRERTTQITFTTISHAIPPDGKKRMRGLEDQMYAEDRELLDIKEAKYNLESYMYEMKNGVGDYGNYEHYIDPKIKAQFIQTLAETEEWIYADGENAPLDAQRSKLQNLQTIGEPVKSRYKFRSEFEEWVGIFEKFKQKASE